MNGHGFGWMRGQHIHANPRRVRMVSDREGEPCKIADYMRQADDVPIVTDADSVYHGGNAYAKPQPLNVLRDTVVGRGLMQLCRYSQQWAFKRPYPADFFRSIEVLQTNLDWFWRSWFYGTGHVDIAIDDVSVFVKDLPGQDIQGAEERT